MQGCGKHYGLTAQLKDSLLISQTLPLTLGFGLATGECKDALRTFTSELNARHSYRKHNASADGCHGAPPCQWIYGQKQKPTPVPGFFNATRPFVKQR